MMKSMKAITRKEEKEINRDLHLSMRAIDLMDFVRRYYYLEFGRHRTSAMHMERKDRTEEISIDCVKDYALRLGSFSYYSKKPEVIFWKIFTLFLFEKRITLASPGTFTINENFFDGGGLIKHDWTWSDVDVTKCTDCD